jgi:hypothetical protein
MDRENTSLEGHFQAKRYGLFILRRREDGEADRNAA